MTLLKMSIYGAVIILAIILIRTFTLHKLPKKTFLILWSVALLRLLVPFEIASEYSLYSLVPEELTEQFSEETATSKENTEIKTLEEAIQNLRNIQSMESEEVSSASSDNNASHNNNTDNPIYLPIEDLDTDAIQLPNAEPDSLSKLPMDTVREKTTPDISELFLDNFPTVIWATGTLLSAAFFLISYLRCYAEFRTALPVTNEYARDFLRHHWTNRIIRLRQSDRISAPLTYGIFRPVILLPKKMDWENHSQMDYILYHEFTHIRRFGLVPKFLMTAALCIHWFNPLVWAMYYFFNRDIELSCDECVVIYYENDNTKADYARTLISMEEKKSRLTPLCNNFSKNAIQERITSIMKFKQTTTGMLFAGIVIVAAVVITLATSASTKTEGAETGLTPFRLIDFESGEFDEESFAKNIWSRFEHYREVYNTCVNTSMNQENYTLADYVPIEVDTGEYLLSSYYLPVENSRFSSLQDFRDYIESIYTKETAEQLYLWEFGDLDKTLGKRKPDLAEYNGKLYTLPYNKEAPVAYGKGQVTFFLTPANDVYLVLWNTPTNQFLEVGFRYENDNWYVFTSHFSNYLADDINNSLYKFSMSTAELSGPENNTESPQTTPAPTDIPTADTPLWQTVARDAIGMLYGGDGSAYKIAEQDDGLLSLADFAPQNLTIDLSAYSTDREWLENGVFYDKEQHCCYVVYSLSPNTEVTEGPCILLVTIPADQPESYTVFPLGDAEEPSLTYSWTRHPVKIGTNIYLNNQHPFQHMWYIDTVTGKLHSLAYVNETLNTKAAAYLSSQGLEADCNTVCGIAGQMGNHIVYYAEASLSTDLSSPDFTVYLVYYNNRVVGEQPLVAEYIEEHTH